MRPEIVFVIILFCLVAGVYLSGITGFFLSRGGGQGDYADNITSADSEIPVEDFKEINESEVTEDEEETEPEENETEPFERPEEDYGGRGSYQTQQSECSKDHDCGADYWGDPYCVDDKVYQNKTTYICVNPGTLNAYCSVSRTTELKEECEICYDGECVTTIVFVDPSYSEVSNNDNFTIRVNISTVNSTFAAQFDLYFDPNILEVLNVDEGDFLKQDGASTYPLIDFDNNLSKIVFANTRFNTHIGISGTGSLGIIRFNGESHGLSNLTLLDVLVTDSHVNIVPSSVSDGVVNVK